MGQHTSDPGRAFRTLHPPTLHPIGLLVQDWGLDAAHSTQASGSKLSQKGVADP